MQEINIKIIINQLLKKFKVVLLNWCNRFFKASCSGWTNSRHKQYSFSIFIWSYFCAIRFLTVKYFYAFNISLYTLFWKVILIYLWLLYAAYFIKTIKKMNFINKMISKYLFFQILIFEWHWGITLEMSYYKRFNYYFFNFFIWIWDMIIFVNRIFCCFKKTWILDIF